MPLEFEREKAGCGADVEDAHACHAVWETENWQLRAKIIDAGGDQPIAQVDGVIPVIMLQSQPTRPLVKRPDPLLVFLACGVPFAVWLRRLGWAKDLAADSSGQSRNAFISDHLRRSTQYAHGEPPCSTAFRWRDDNMRERNKKGISDPTGAGSLFPLCSLAFTRYFFFAFACFSSNSLTYLGELALNSSRKPEQQT